MDCSMGVNGRPPVKVLIDRATGPALSPRTSSRLFSLSLFRLAEPRASVPTTLDTGQPRATPESSAIRKLSSARNLSSAGGRLPKVFGSD